MTKKLFLILFIACAYKVSGQNLVWQTNPTTLWTPGKVGIGDNNTTNSNLLVTQVNNCIGGGCNSTLCSLADPMLWVRQKWINTSSTTYTDAFSVNLHGVGIGLKNSMYPLHVSQSISPTVNSVTAYFSTLQDANTWNSRNMFFVNYLGSAGFNTIQKLGDQGIFWNDGQSNTGNNDGCTNKPIYKNGTGGFVIAPVQDPNAASAPPAVGLRIDNTGKVGIGIITPVEMLEVAGNIRCTKLKVTTQWWDKVFDTSYHLLSLPELEKYVLTYKHLPSMPTEQDIAQNGCDVGDATSLLLKKVEELTLYTIDLQKQIIELQKQLQAKR